MAGDRFYADLPPMPTMPGDVPAAREYHQAIERRLNADDLLLRDDPGRLSRSDRAMLLALGRIWLARASGADPRWMRVGSRPGKPHAHELSRPAAAWAAPLRRGETGTWKGTG
jgi:hypothetical protein